MELSFGLTFVVLFFIVIGCFTIYFLVKKKLHVKSWNIHDTPTTEPWLFAAFLIIAAVSSIGNTIYNLVKGKPNVEGFKIHDIPINASTYGTTIPVIYGGDRVPGNLIWTEGIKQHKNTDNVSGGCGGGGSVTTYYYTCTFIMAFCQGPMAKVLRIWGDTKLIYDITLGNEKVTKIKGIKNTVFYPGSEDQYPDPDMAATLGTDIPAGRGMCCIKFKDLELGQFGNRIPNITAEIVYQAKSAEETNVWSDFDQTDTTNSLVVVKSNRMDNMAILPDNHILVLDVGGSEKVGGWWSIPLVATQDEETGQPALNIAPIKGIGDSSNDHSTLVAGYWTGGGPVGGWVIFTSTQHSKNTDQWFPFIRDDQNGGLIGSQIGQNTGVGYPIIEGIPEGYPAFTRLQVNNDPAGNNPFLWGVTTDRKKLLVWDKNTLYPMWKFHATNNSYFLDLSNANAHYGYEMTNYRIMQIAIDRFGNAWIVAVNPDNVKKCRLIKIEIKSVVMPKKAKDLASVTQDNFGSIRFTQLETEVEPGVKTYLPYYDFNWKWQYCGHDWDTTFVIKAANRITIDTQSDIFIIGTTINDLESQDDGNGRLVSWTLANADTAVKTFPLQSWTVGHEPSGITDPVFILDTYDGTGQGLGDGDLSGFDCWSAFNAGPKNNKLWVRGWYKSKDEKDENGNPVNACDVIEIDTKDGTLVRSINLDPDIFYGGVFDPVFMAFWSWRKYTTYDIYGSPIYSYRLIKHSLDRGENEPPALSEVLTDLCNKVGIDSSEVDFSALDDIFISGWGILQRTSLKEAIEPLQAVYFFDIVEIDGKLVAVKRQGKTSIATIEDYEMGIHEPGQDTPDTMQKQIMNEIDLPKQIDLKYIDANSNYHQDVQSSLRRTVNTDEMMTIDLHLVLTDSEAKTFVEQLLYITWKERVLFTFSLPPKYCYLTPTDVITVNNNKSGAVHIIRLTKMTYGSNGEIKCEGRPEELSIYDLVAIGGANEPNEPPAIEDPGPTKFFLLDSPLLADSHDMYKASGYYVAACGIDPDWKSAMLWKSLDSGIHWQELMLLNKISMIGILTKDLGAPVRTTVWDRKNTITLRGFSKGAYSSDNTEFELQSADSDLDVFNGANLAMIVYESVEEGSPYKKFVFGELLQFKTATVNEDGTWELSNLLRGRKGRETNLAHPNGSYFILITDSNLNNLIHRINDSDSLFVDRVYKAVSTGWNFESGQQAWFKNKGMDKKPLSPVHITSVTDSETGDVTISWIRRDRKGQGWLNVMGVPMSETVEQYEIVIYIPEEVVTWDDVIQAYVDYANGNITWSEVIAVYNAYTNQDNVPYRTHTYQSNLNTPSFVYTRDAMIQDFGSVPQNFWVGIAQISDLVGAGDYGYKLIMV
jgi:hypothetical protein